MNKICTYAWKGLHITPNSDVTMCCLQKRQLPYHDDRVSETNCISDIRNSEKWNNIRQSMLDGDEHDSCQVCWDNENAGIISMRQVSNNFHSDYYNEIIDNNSSELFDDKLGMIDIRQSNICNMKCLSCSPWFSSLWNLESIKHNTPFAKHLPGTSTKNNGVLEVNENLLIDTVMENITYINEFYFAGGEPMLNKIHWDILEELDRIGRYDVKIVYNTNLLKLDYKGKHIFDYWDKFTNWHAGISIDAIGNRGEYVRTGTNWDILDHNISQVAKHYNNKINFDVTISALNLGGLVELLDYTKSKSINNIVYTNFVYSPSWLSVNNLPLHYRENIINDIQEFIKQQDNPEFLRFLDNGFKDFKIKIEQSHRFKNQDSVGFKDFIKTYDQIRKTNIFDACPEFLELWDEIE